jgi:hypothetical protein
MAMITPGYASGVSTLTSGRCTHFLVLLAAPVKVSAICFEITVPGSAEATIKVGLWSIGLDDDGGIASGALLEESPDLAANVAGVITHSFTERVLPAGVYAVGLRSIWTTTSPTVRICVGVAAYATMVFGSLANCSAPTSVYPGVNGSSTGAFGSVPPTNNGPTNSLPYVLVQ